MIYLNEQIRMFCRYAVVDLETSVVLKVGERYKNVMSLQYVSTFRRYPIFGRKINMYVDFRRVKGRKCIIVFWANVPGREAWDKTLFPGGFLGLRPTFYGKKKVLRFKRFIKRLRSHFKSFIKSEFEYLKKRKIDLIRYVGFPGEYARALSCFEGYKQGFISKYNFLRSHGLLGRFKLKESHLKEFVYENV